MAGIQISNSLDHEMEELLYRIIGAAIEVHRVLGPGYLEKVYESALALELDMIGLRFKTQVPVSIIYKNHHISGQVLDMIVEEKVILELKAVDQLHSMHQAQLLSYLKSTALPAGLLINFKEPLLKEGIRRFVNTFSPSLTKSSV